MNTPRIFDRSMSEQVQELVLDTRLNNACATIYTRAAQPRLWMDLGGRVACLTHGGGYLQYAVEAQPTAGEHVTTLTAWVSADGRGFPCEDCGMEDAPRSDEDAVVRGVLAYDVERETVTLTDVDGTSRRSVWSRENGLDDDIVATSVPILDVRSALRRTDA